MNKLARYLLLSSVLLCGCQLEENQSSAQDRGAARENAPLPIGGWNCLDVRELLHDARGFHRFLVQR